MALTKVPDNMLVSPPVGAVADISERDAIANRYEGLVVYVASEQINYQLVGGTDNEHWAPLNGSGVTYFGDPTTEGSWRIYKDGTDLKIQLRSGGLWQDRDTFTP